MSAQHVRVRFAPSPTGPLHIGGVRTALYNYLFAKKHGGSFILRIEDTDQTRYVEGAEQYILESLSWLGLIPDESVAVGGAYGPYRQSDRKDIYQSQVRHLIENGWAYYAFDTPEELEQMRTKQMAIGVHTPKYDHTIRMDMKNSLTLDNSEVQRYISAGDNVTVRLKVPEGETISFEDEIRGVVSFDTAELDDKVLMKADGLPTYHLANVIDDHMMHISHVIRGEEWLSSTAHHVLLYRAFGWSETQPKFAHLPLILKPTGKGKLSKRDGAKFGFPVFPLEWHGSTEDEYFMGFREAGFTVPALINFLSLLGWNPGTDQELFTMKELIQSFDINHINKSGAQFNYDKASWFNQQYIMQMSSDEILSLLSDDFKSLADKGYLLKVIDQLKPRVTFLGDFKVQSDYFFSSPKTLDEAALKKKYKPELKGHFEALSSLIHSAVPEKDAIQSDIKNYIQQEGLKMGDIFPVLRLLIAGSMAGPDLFEMISIIGTEECAKRILEGTAKAS